MIKSDLIKVTQEALEALPMKFDTKEQLHSAFTTYLKTFPKASALYKLGVELPLDIDTFLTNADAFALGTFQVGMTRFALKTYF